MTGAQQAELARLQLEVANSGGTHSWRQPFMGRHAPVVFTASWGSNVEREVVILPSGKRL